MPVSTQASKGDPAKTIRFPKPVLKALKTAAKQSGRSENSEVIFRLSESLGLMGEGEQKAAGT